PCHALHTLTLHDALPIYDFGGKVLDKPISVIVGDHQLKPDIGAAIARRWYDTEQVDLIVDVPVSAVGLAVQTIATEKKRLFITRSEEHTSELQSHLNLVC